MSEPLVHYESVDDLRRSLMKGFKIHQEFAERHVRDGDVPAVSTAVTAFNLYYTLSAVLGVAQREFGPEVARRLALVAEDVMANGDSVGHNLDLDGPGT
jgi:hypothetical protein